MNRLIENLKPPRVIRLEMAERFRKVRLAQNLSQKDVAQRSGVSLASVRKFETTGDISLKGLVNLAIVVSKAGDFASVFEEPPAIDLFEPKPKERKRASPRRKKA